MHGGAAAADWWGQALFGEEGVGGGHEGDVVVSALSGTASKWSRPRPRLSSR